MSDKNRTDTNRLDAYFDNLLTSEEAESFLSQSDDREQLLDQKKLQSKIDDSIQRLFQLDPLSDQKIEQIMGSVQLGLRPRHSQRQNLARLAIAASLFVIAGVGIWQGSNSWRVKAPFFQPRSLAKIYEETVDRGFSPYYECHDQQRFADVFAKRQRQRLGLAVLPNGSRMLGISYLGGLSRDTTAMLCQVDNKNIIVFVDTLKNDQRRVAMSDNKSKLNIFRIVKNGLVFYEVSPLEKSTMIEHFEFQ